MASSRLGLGLGLGVEIVDRVRDRSMPRYGAPMDSGPVRMNCFSRYTHVLTLTLTHVNCFSRYT